MKQYFYDIYLAITSVLIGMKITFGHLFTRSITLQYPREKAPMFDRSRNRLHVDIEDCIGCYQCDKACPVDCIHIDTIKARPGEDLGLTEKFEKKKTFVFPKFDIDMAECCYCGLCVFPCPTECIYWISDYEFAEYDRSNLNYNFGNITPDEARVRYEEAEKLKIEKEKQIAAKKAVPQPSEPDEEKNDFTE
ncbi:MAG: 4Fe-4S dicluster domain-containing protein [Candidatus Marinimicrobia bacterium]|nr:4Fe-4S dicluster domain-containing protein [Candidatus Neomarinimicrobiota bacterium]